MVNEANRLNRREQSKQQKKQGARSLRTHFFLLIATILPLFALGLSNHGLWTADEPRVAEISREMALSGDWAVPTLNKKPFLEEPPLYYASVASVFRVFGAASDRIARIPSALFALGGVAALFFLASMLFGPRVGFLSGFVLATCGEYFRVAHWLLVDSALTCFVITAMAFFMAAYRTSNGRKRILFYVACYISCTLAFYSKGFIGIAIPGLAVLAFIILDRNFREALRMQLWLGALVFVLMAAPWFAALWYGGGSEHLRVYLVYNHLQRFLPGGSSGHHQPFYYYLTQFPAGFLPWSILLVSVIYFCVARRHRAPTSQQKGLLFAECWFITGFLFFSLASTKRVLYLMPIFAPAAMLTASYIETTLGSRTLSRIERVFLWIFGCILLVIGLSCVPTYLYAARLYAIGTSLKLLFAVIVAAVITVLFSLFSLCYLARRRTGHFWIYSSAAIYTYLIVALVIAVPLLDRYKSLVPFCQQVKRVVATDAMLYAYQPDETLRGALPFYTGYHPKEMEDLKDLENLASSRSQVFVAIRDSHGRLEKELLSTGRFTVLSRYDMGPDRSLVLLANKK
ncbi:MAG TPA: glycosyltransferase family 39 protein [Syntrophorhabdales bacterium]|nr:glycosyltransferase family 39 protein [Syntrophorhabdales bacterium]